MKFFVLQSVWDIEFIDLEEFEQKCKSLNINTETTNIFGLKGKLQTLNNEEFANLLPLLNWFFGKYYFVDFGLSLVEENTLLWENVHSLKYHQQEIENIQYKIMSINAELKSWKLLTKSKKQDYFNRIQASIYAITSFLVKTYFLILEATENKQELQNIVSDAATLQEFRSNAYLIQQVSWDKLELLVWRFEFLTTQLQVFSEIMQKYFNTYIK